MADSSVSCCDLVEALLQLQQIDVWCATPSGSERSARSLGVMDISAIPKSGDVVQMVEPPLGVREVLG